MLAPQIETLNQMLTAHLHRLGAEIGPRPSGSVANHAAAEYIRDIFRQCDLEVEMQTFSCIAWEDRGTTLELGGDRLGHIRCMRNLSIGTIMALRVSFP